MQPHTDRVIRSSIVQLMKETLTVDVDENRKIFNKLPGFCFIGDSISARQNKQINLESVTANGKIITAVFSGNHGLNLNNHVFINSTVDAAYHGWYRVQSIPTTSTFTYHVKKEPSISVDNTSLIRCVIQEQLYDSNWAGVGSSLAKRKGLYLGNYGWGSSKTSDLDEQLDFALDRVGTLWGDHGADIIFICSGVNDIAADVDIENIKVNLGAAIERISNVGIRPVISTLYPLDNTHPGHAISSAINHCKLNRWIREVAPTMGATVIDVSSVVVDPFSEYGNYISGYSADGLHPDKNATFAVAKLVNKKLWATISSVDTRIGASVSNNNTLSGTSGSNVGTGTSTGDVADNMSLGAYIGGSVVGSKGIADDGSGELQRIVATSSADNDWFAFFGDNLTTADFKAGDRIVCRMQVVVHSDIVTENFRNMSLYGAHTVDGVETTRCVSDIGDNGDHSVTLGEPYSVTLETPPVLIHDLSTLLNFKLLMYFNGAGEITVDVTNYDIIKY